MKKTVQPKGMPFNSDPNDPYNPDGMSYAHFFEDENFMPTKERWTECAKIPPKVNAPYLYYPFSPTKCAIVVRDMTANKENYALQDPEGNVLLSAGMNKAIKQSTEQSETE